MNYRILGKTGLKISEVSLGTWQVGGGWGGDFDKQKAKEIISTALDHGVNFLDTADVYDDQQSERVVGEFVKNDRDNLHIATKIGRRISPHVAEGYTPDVLEKYVDEALINTGLDYLDLVQLHCPPTSVFSNEAIFDRLEEIKQKGKVKHFGVSVEKVEEAIMASKHDVVASVQIIFNMFRQKPLDEYFNHLANKNIGVIARVPLASGLLTGKMSMDRSFHKDDHRNFNRNGEVFDKGETFSGVPLKLGLKAVGELKRYFGDENIVKYALRWILMFDEISTVIPGASNKNQVKGNLESSLLPPFNEDLMHMVKEIYDEYIRSEVHDHW